MTPHFLPQEELGPQKSDASENSGRILISRRVCAGHPIRCAASILIWTFLQPLNCELSPVRHPVRQKKNGRPKCGCARPFVPTRNHPESCSCLLRFTLYHASDLIFWADSSPVSNARKLVAAILLRSDVANVGTCARHSRYHRLVASQYSLEILL
jgi:hypothetical protein